MKYVVITGAYGGMGYKTTMMLASKGFTVFALDKAVTHRAEWANHLRDVRSKPNR